MSQFDDSLGGGPGSGQPVGKGVGGGVGRGDGQGSEGTSGDGHWPSSHGSPQPAGVVIRASVEHVGLVGDTELTVNVKWPASTFCVQAGKKPPVPAVQASDSQHVPANGPDASNFVTLFGEAVADPGPYNVTISTAELEALIAEPDADKVRRTLVKIASKDKPAGSESETECNPDKKA